MKFVSWNVNGLRACIQKGFLEQFDRFDADFFCLQETKLSEGQLELDLPGYEQYWCYAEKKGYSGTAIFTKHTPLSVQYGLGIPELDNEGRLITLEYPEFYLVTCYTPNAQRGLARIDHRLTWDDAFRMYLQKLDRVKPVILCGDLNVAHREIDLKNPASNRGNAGFSDQERQSFQQTLDLGFTDTFRHLHPDTTGAYSWWSYMFKARENNAGWRIDYFLTSDRLRDSIYRAEIHSDVFGSDHCPVSLDLSILCNGGFWSPLQQGTSRQILPEGTGKSSKDNTARPSAGSAKGLVALGAAFLLLIAGVLLWRPWAVQEPETGEPLISVHVYTEPITHATKTVTHPIETVVPIENRFTDGTQVFYSISSVSTTSMTNYNTWVRIDVLTNGIHPGSLRYEAPFGSSYSVKQLQYYTDETCTQFGGWLLFLNLDEPMEFTFYLNSHTQSDPLTALITPAPPTMPEYPVLDILAYSQPLSVMEQSSGTVRIYCDDLTLYAVDVPMYFIEEFSYPFSNSWFFVRAESRLQPFLFGSSITLSCDLSFPVSDADQLLGPSGQFVKSVPVYSDADQSTQLGWMVYGTMDTTTLLSLNMFREGEEDQPLWSSYTAPEPYLSLDHTQQMSTSWLMRFAASHIGIQINLSPTSSYWDPDQFLLDYPAAAALLDRADAVSVLMNDKLSEHVHLSVAERLLSMIVDKMTPLEEANFLTMNYPNAPYQNYPIQITDPNVGDYSIEELARKVLTEERFGEYLPQCSNMQTAYYVFQYCQNDYYLVRLANRPNLDTNLAKLAEEDPETFRTLNRFWEFMTQLRGVAYLSTEIVLNQLFEDESLCLQLINHYSPELIYNDPLLTTLIGRTDAIDLLLNAQPEQLWARRVPQVLLESVFLEDMTSQQAAQVITGLYPSCPDPFTFTLDYSGDPYTSALVNTLAFQGGELYSMFQRIPAENYTATRQEIYNLLLPYCPLLQELETRSDALATLRLQYFADPDAQSPIKDILDIYEWKLFFCDPTVAETLASMDASSWFQTASTLDGYVYMGSFPYLYSPADEQPNLNNADYALLVVPNENLMSISHLRTVELTTRTYNCHIRPCYFDVECTQFAGWLVYGTTPTSIQVEVELDTGTGVKLTTVFDVSPSSDAAA